MALITERYADCITTTFSCFDRVVVTGTWVDFGHSHSMAATLTARGIRLFDYTKFAEPLRDQLVATAQRVAADGTGGPEMPEKTPAALAEVGGGGM